MRIGELSSRSRVDARLLRYYEAQGLLEPGRNSSGYRDYADSDVAVVRRIRALLAAGLSTATIAEVQRCLRGDRPIVPACPGVVTRLRQERARLDDAIGRLLAARSALDDVIDA